MTQHIGEGYFTRDSNMFYQPARSTQPSLNTALRLA